MMLLYSSHARQAAFAIKSTFSKKKGRMSSDKVAEFDNLIVQEVNEINDLYQKKKAHSEKIEAEFLNLEESFSDGNVEWSPRTCKYNN